MPFSKFSTVLSVAGLLAGAAEVSAAEPADPPADEIVVSASRAPRPAEQVGAAVTTIDAEAIARGQYAFLADALSAAPGVAPATAGAEGGTSSVRLRGGASGQTLVVIDGIVVNDPAAPQGGFDFASLDVGGIDRIEILRGPQSILYGSEAIGGVIAIETARRPGRALSLRTEGGALGTARAAAEFSVGDADGFARLSFAGSRTDGVSRAAVGSERDGYRLAAASLRAGHAVGGRWRAELIARAALSEAEIDGFPPPLFTFADTDETQRDEAFLVAARAERTGRPNAALTLSYSSLDRSNLDGEARTFAASGGRLAADALADVALAERLDLVTGARIERTAADTSGVDDDTMTAGAFALLEWTPLDPVHLSAGVRHDAHADFDDATTARLSGAFEPLEGLILRASWGQGFRAPSLFELHYAGFGVTPNPNLAPERASGFDAGVEVRRGALVVRSAWFQLAVEDQIDFDLVRNGYYNIDRTRSRGVEAEGTLEVGAASLSAAYTYTDARDRAAGARLLRIPKHLVSGEVAAEPAPGVRLSARVLYNSSEADFPAPNASFIRLDLRAAWAFDDAAEIYARIENATDASYQDISGYGEPGAAIYAGLRVRL